MSAVYTYNDVVLCAQVRRGLLSSERVVRNNSGCSGSSKISSCSQSCSCIPRLNLPTGRVVEKALAWLLANRENYIAENTSVHRQLEYILHAIERPKRAIDCRT